MEDEEGSGNVYDQGTQDALCYVLGRRGALSAFHGIELPAQRRRIASMSLAPGSVQADERFDRMYDAILLDHGLEQELMKVFIEQFALSEEESRETIRSYPADTRRRRYATYGKRERIVSWPPSLLEMRREIPRKRWTANRRLPTKFNLPPSQVTFRA